MALAQGKNLVVSDSRNGRLSVFTDQGDFLRWIGKDCIREPFGLCVDSKGHILVADLEAGVFCFSQEGKKLATFGKGFMVKVWDVEIGRDGTLWVTMRSSGGASRIYLY